MTIRCLVSDCRYNDGGWCDLDIDLDIIEIDTDRMCAEYEPAEHPAKHQRRWKR